MRLINCRSTPPRLEEFPGIPAAPFAILSHTWKEGQEVSYQMFINNQTSISTNGWDKIYRACKEAHELGFDYIWIDTCCINKESLVELSEAINSMFQWYSDAAMCIVFLADCKASKNLGALRQARWFTRGWTLQELVASRTCRFYDASWTFFGTRDSLCERLAHITGIDAQVLAPQPGVNLRDLLDAIPIARRMSWASSRVTGRPEDISYCLIGLFGVNMPLLYGEGAQRAFVRLQEEIIRDSNDLSIFAWTSPFNSKPRGIFAQSPWEFSQLGSLVLHHNLKFGPEFSIGNKGLRIDTSLQRDGGSGHVIMPLHARMVGGYKMSQLGIYLKHEGASVYIRVRPNELATIPADTLSDNHSIFVAKHLRMTADALAVGELSRQDSLHNFGLVQFRVMDRFPPKTGFKILTAEPANLWDGLNWQFVTRGQRSFAAFIHFRTDATLSTHTVACGFTESGTTWVVLDDGFGDISRAVRSKDFQWLAKTGPEQVQPQRRRQNLPTAQAYIQKATSDAVHRRRSPKAPHSALPVPGPNPAVISLIYATSSFMEHLAKILKPIPLVVWGGPALQQCGVKAFIRGFIFIVNECDRDLATAKLHDAGYIPAPWSWGSCDPAVLEGYDDDVKRIHAETIPEYADIDNNSVRFAFPPEHTELDNEPIAFVLPSFVGLGPPRTLESNNRHNEDSSLAKDTTEDPRFTCEDGFLYYPRTAVLLESLIRARLRVPEGTLSLWRSMPEVWAIPYLWTHTMAPEDVLDSVHDEEVKSWFNKATKRYEGGIDRVTITKRQGRVKSTRPTAGVGLSSWDESSGDLQKSERG